MKFEFRKLSIALIVIYTACTIFTAFVLFRLPDDLVHSGQSVSVASIETAWPAFLKLYAVVGVTLVIGMGAIVVAMNSKTTEVIRVEKKKTNDLKSQQDEGEQTTSHTLDLKDVQQLIAGMSGEAAIAKAILVHICKHLEAGIGAFYTTATREDKRIIEMKASYALVLGESQTITFEFGEGLVGQAALEKKSLIIDDIPEGYVKIVSGLGNATPTHLLVVPVMNGNELYGVVEIASFTVLGQKEADMVKAAFKQMIDKVIGDSGEGKNIDFFDSDDRKEEGDIDTDKTDNNEA